MNRKSSKGNYDKDFIKMIVEMYEDGHKISELCSDYEIKDVTIRSWIKKFSTHTPTYNDSVENKSMTDAEVKAMSKEIEQLKRENETLKKCVTIFSRK